MKVFLAGASGAIGRRLLPRLIAAGHEVVALTRDAERAASLEAAGARAVVADALDAAALADAVLAARPDAVVHQLTALSGGIDFRRLDDDLAMTNRLRTEATDTLLRAAREAGARRFVAQSLCGWPFARVGGPVKTEEDPLDDDPPAAFRRTLAALRHLEGAVRASSDVPALALRLGFLYGPGTSIAQGGEIAALVRARKLPIVGGGGGVWSFLHVDDAAGATVAALERGAPGIYNVVDDDPAPVAAWLPALAAAVGAPPPRRVPAWLARPAIGAGGVMLMTTARGGSNAKAKGELGWAPAHASWREGFGEGLG